jgi:hypothetical protein
VYATHDPPVTNPHPGTITYTGFPRTTNPSNFYKACWDTVAPVAGFQSRLEDNGTKSFFVGYNLFKSKYSTRATLGRHTMETRIDLDGNLYLPQVPIPENINITKVYVSQMALPEENVDPVQYISQELQDFFAPFATVLKITLPKWISGHYSKYHLDAHVFLAPLQDEDEITFPVAIPKQDVNGHVRPAFSENYVSLSSI